MKNSIVLVPFPFDDFSSVKVRPALCLTNQIGIYNHIVIALISSQISANSLQSDFKIIANENLETGLHVDSIIKLHKVVTIPKELIKRKLGELSDINAKIVEKKLLELFEIKHAE
mgnify:CR=1 FL=1